MFYTCNGSFSKIPIVWQNDLKLTYHFSGGHSMDFQKIEIDRKTLRYHKKYFDGTSYQESDKQFPIEEADLNDLLDVLRKNDADCIRMEKTEVLYYDAPSFTLRLEKGNEQLINLSNGAHYILPKTYYERYRNIINRIEMTANRMKER